MVHLHAAYGLLRYLLQTLAMATIVVAVLITVTASVLAALGVWPWLDVPLSRNGTPVANAGIYVQLGIAALAFCLLAYLPTNARVLALENSHRQFHVGMQDIARAYGAVHAADRGEVFQLSGEFEAVRERLAYLRDHPDLGNLEPEVLETAAQMSFLSKELAEVYSDEKVTRAREFLTQRQYEVEQFNTRLDRAKAISSELSHWHAQIELEESVAAAQLDRLRDSLEEVLPELGRSRVVPLDPALQEDAGAQPRHDADVTHLPRAAE